MTLRGWIGITLLWQLVAVLYSIDDQEWWLTGFGVVAMAGTLWVFIQEGLDAAE